METYNYRTAIIDDIRNYIECNDIQVLHYADRDEAFEALNDMLWTADSVTGNGSGSYTFNAWKAEENLCHNWDLLAEAMEEFCTPAKELANGPEWADVTIRCYLLGECLSEVLEDYEWSEDEDEDENED